MIEAPLLAALALVDTAFAGYRDASGLDARIDKRAYYLQSMLRGARWGAVAIAIAGAAFVACGGLGDAAFAADIGRVARGMLTAYVPYAALVIALFVVRIARSVDVRSMLSMLFFGPLTAARPAVIVAGAIYALGPARDPRVVGLTVFVAALMLGFGPFLRWGRGRS